MTEGQRFMITYYDFAEKCDDDFDIMVKAIKIAGSKRRPNIIRKHLENFDCDRGYCSYYLKIFVNVNQDFIDKARWQVQLEHGKQPTLF